MVYVVFYSSDFRKENFSYPICVQKTLEGGTKALNDLLKKDDYKDYEPEDTLDIFKDQVKGGTLLKAISLFDYMMTFCLIEMDVED